MKSHEISLETCEAFTCVHRSLSHSQAPALQSRRLMSLSMVLGTPTTAHSHPKLKQFEMPLVTMDDTVSSVGEIRANFLHLVIGLMSTWPLGLATTNNTMASRLLLCFSHQNLPKETACLSVFHHHPRRSVGERPSSSTSLPQDR